VTSRQACLRRCAHDGHVPRPSHREHGSAVIVLARVVEAEAVLIDISDTSVRSRNAFSSTPPFATR
jgi:hypothetical protein